MAVDRIRVIKRWVFKNDGSVLIRFSGASDLIYAKTLEVKRNPSGEFLSALLDRCIHANHERDFKLRGDNGDEILLRVGGAFVTSIWDPRFF